MPLPFSVRRGGDASRRSSPRARRGSRRCPGRSRPASGSATRAGDRAGAGICVSIVPVLALMALTVPSGHGWKRGRTGARWSRETRFGTRSAGDPRACPLRRTSPTAAARARRAAPRDETSPGARRDRARRDGAGAAGRARRPAARAAPDPADGGGGAATKADAARDPRLARRGADRHRGVRLRRDAAAARRARRDARAGGARQRVHEGAQRRRGHHAVDLVPRRRRLRGGDRGAGGGGRLPAPPRDVRTREGPDAPRRDPARAARHG